MIENVERLGTELNVHTLFDRSVLTNRQVDVLETGSFNDVSPGITETSRVAYKGIFVEEQLRLRIGKLDLFAGNQVWTVEGEQTSAGSAVGKQWNDRTKRISRLEVQDRRNAPSVGESAKKRALSLDRQGVDTAQNKTLTRIEIRKSPFRCQVPEILSLGIAASDRIVIDRLRECVRTGER